MPVGQVPCIIGKCVTSDMRHCAKSRQLSWPRARSALPLLSSDLRLPPIMPLFES